MSYNIVTRANADIEDKIPSFVQGLQDLSPSGDAFAAWKRHKAAGYDTVIGVRSSERITIGSISSEWRPLGSAMFFVKGPVPHLRDGELIDFLRSVRSVSVPLTVYAKCYSYMSGCGRGWLGGMLTPANVAEYITYFECSKACVNTTDELIANNKFTWRE